MNRLIGELVVLLVIVVELPTIAREAHEHLPTIVALLVLLMIVRLALPSRR